MIVSILYKGATRLINSVAGVYHQAITWMILKGNNVQVISFKTKGIPYVVIARGAKCTIGKNLTMNNILRANPIGRAQKCVLAVDTNAEIVIGDNVGMSFTAINAQIKITIGNDVVIGGGTCIYDSDYHPLDADERKINDDRNTIKSPVMIHDNVFIGTNCTILKGVVIGRNSIIGACSVVTKSVPENEIWAGNPAKFIKHLSI